MTERMTRAEREELAKLVRLRAKLAKTDIDQRAAKLIADIEEQLAARYASSHEAWSEVTEQAAKLVREADEEIATRCRQLGIPENFRPGLNLSWYGRGENADRERRAELRKVAQTRLADRARLGKLEVDREAARQLTELASGALESSEARAFLESMPSAEELIPAITLPQLER